MRRVADGYLPPVEGSEELWVQHTEHGRVTPLNLFLAQTTAYSQTDP